MAILHASCLLHRARHSSRLPAALACAGQTPVNISSAALHHAAAPAMPTGGESTPGLALCSVGLRQAEVGRGQPACEGVLRRVPLMISWCLAWWTKGLVTSHRSSHPAMTCQSPAGRRPACRAAAVTCPVNVFCRQAATPAFLEPSHMPMSWCVTALKTAQNAQAHDMLHGTSSFCLQANQCALLRCLHSALAECTGPHCFRGAQDGCSCNDSL